MLKILCVGKIKEGFIKDGILEYSKRISGYDKFQITEVKEFNQKTIKQNIYDEGTLLLQEINDKDSCEEPISWLNEEISITPFVGDIRKLEFKDQYDLINLSNIMEYICSSSDFKSYIEYIK